MRSQGVKWSPFMSVPPTIIYTKTDEAPLLATYSFLPVIEAFTKQADIAVKIRDISLAARIISQFTDRLAPNQVADDALAELGDLTHRPEANIIKLPNISASIPQLQAAIAELQQQGLDLPNYPEVPRTDDEKEIRKRYDKVKGSAVNPVLREGNSDRRAPKAVKDYARQHPHKMGAWAPDSKTRVATMRKDDFFSNEQSITLGKPTTARIEFLPTQGTPTLFKQGIKLEAEEILDATFMSKRGLTTFFTLQIAAAEDLGVLFSLHLKATMMKVSDPIVFGHAVEAFLGDFTTKHEETLAKLGVDFSHGLGGMKAKLEQLPPAEKALLEADLEAALAARPSLAMVNSDKGITNLHVPSDIIIDASMPAMIREGGKMWNAQGGTEDTLAVIPDSSYAAVYQAVIEFCQKHGALDPQTMGSVPNVGLMAQKAEEYGSHDKTFEIPENGMMRVVDAEGKVLTEHQVESGDIWRACQTKDAAISDWVKLAVRRARATGAPAIFWLDRARAHDKELLAKVEKYLGEEETNDLDIRIMPPAEACQFSLERIAQGQDTISVTGNVLRDYLTDLFPILEVGTSAKMLSVVPLMNGGGLFETGAGGSAPKHVQQFLAENYLRWDSLGEFFALAASLEHLGDTHNHAKAKVLAKTLDDATGQLLQNNKGPSRKLGGLDNRGSHFYLALYWAQALAAQEKDAELSEIFTPLAKDLTENEEKIVAELTSVQGHPTEIGGYYRPDDAKASAALRPSGTFNDLLAKI